MFDATTQGGSPLTLQMPFWQCVKAGIGFTLGAGVVSAIGFVIWVTVLLPIWYRVLLASLRH